MGTGESALAVMLQRYGQWATGHPYLVLVLSVLLALGTGAGVARLGFSTDYRVYFGAENPQLQNFNQFQDVYGNSDFTYFAVSAKSLSPDSAFSPEVLSAVRDLTREAWALPFAMRVDSLTNFQHTRAVGDELQVADLLPDEAAITAERIAWLREIALQEPALLNAAVTAAGTVASVRVTTEMPMASLFELPDHVAAVRALRDRILAVHPDVQIHMTGTNLMNNAFNEAALHDGVTLIPLMYALIIAITYFMFRSVSITFATVLVLLFSNLVAMGWAGYASILLTPPSMLAPLAITTLAVADSVHICVAAFALMRGGLPRAEAVVTAVSDNFVPVMLTGITTAIGFLTMNMLDAPPLRDLGNITAVGVIMASLWSVFLLPALLMLLPVRVSAGRHNKLENAMAGLGEAVLRYPRLALWGALLLALGLSLGLFRNQAADNFNNYFDTRVDFKVENDFVIRHMTGTFYVDISLDSGRADGMTDPLVLAQVDAFSRWWRQQPEVTYVGSIADVFKRLNKSMHGDDPAWNVLPESQPLAAQYLLLYEMSLPFGQDLGNQLNIDKSATRMTVFVDADHVTEFLQIVGQGEAWLAQNAPDLRAYATGPALMFSHISHSNISAMVPQAVTMFLVMAVVLIFALRSIRFGLLSLVTLTLPVSVAFGIWGFFNGEINFTMAAIIGLVTGICDDDTVHFLNDYLRMRREQGMTPRNALRHTFRHTGVAILVTTVVLVGGFMIMAQSAFLPNSGMAQLASLSFSAALILNLLLLPGLVLLIDRNPVWGGQGAAAGPVLAESA